MHLLANINGSFLMRVGSAVRTASKMILCWSAQRTLRECRRGFLTLLRKSVSELFTACYVVFAGKGSGVKGPCFATVDECKVSKLCGFGIDRISQVVGKQRFMEIASATKNGVLTQKKRLRIGRCKMSR